MGDAAGVGGSEAVGVDGSSAFSLGGGERVAYYLLGFAAGASLGAGAAFGACLLAI